MGIKGNFKYHVIYKVINLQNGLTYIGQHRTNDPYDNYIGSGVAMRKAIKKYGKKSFKKEIICFCKDSDEANEKEIFYIEKYDSINHGYNIAKGGRGCLGVFWSPEKKKKDSDSLKLFHKLHPNAMKGERNPFFGRHLSKEHIALLTRTRVAAITGANNPSARAVVCIETQERFSTAKMAVQRYGNNEDPSQIIKVCRGRVKTAYGYHWEYAK